MINCDEKKATSMQQSWAALRQRLIPHEGAKLFVLLWILAYAWITSWSHFKQQAGWKLQSPSLQGIEHLEIARRLLGRFLHVYRFISQPGLSGLEVSKAPGCDNKVRQSVYDCICFYRANFTWIACSHIHNWVNQVEASCRKLGACLFSSHKKDMQTNWCWGFNRELGSNMTMCVCVCVQNVRSISFCDTALQHILHYRQSSICYLYRTDWNSRFVNSHALLL